ncbi:winged helix-turn-helix domain-containing protein [Companilactobacillus mishanensis]|uniref:Winged helix-turn-helix domain-containing protein n=1 Tax=Companilactobacillus mishanensis TaxID=2486008 RepID=A0ABW9P6Y3_9LACO|nr:winged helix-turn-helix domain-containing protein [Companilactobacillus mishanensis]MQS45034.1 winged helix-turn-helix domain-containing protein [Companilactobacillus mishanensis]MQS90293.1 winged helix-turn-helix domain-containing protein [Companilactobacillus mishanensis]
MDKKHIKPSSDSLYSIIVNLTGTKPNLTLIVSDTKLSRSTVNDALYKSVGKTSFDVATRILKSTDVSIDEVVEHLEQEIRDPKTEELKFINETDLSTLTIMGIQFSTKGNYWKTRDAIMNNIYEGFYPTKRNVEESYQILEKNASSEKIINDFLDENREN